MGLAYPHLDARTRKLMLSELLRSGLPPCPRLSPSGKERWPKLLETAVREGDDATLAASLRGCFNSHDAHGARVPKNAATVTAEDAFNRLYVRALCLRAIEDGIEELEVFRAKPVECPRPESEARIGKAVRAEALLADLRAEESVMGVPGGFGSGLSVRFFAMSNPALASAGTGQSLGVELP